jgi:hypothetical protein
MIPFMDRSFRADIFQNFPISGVGGGGGVGTSQLGVPNRECNMTYPGMMPMPWIDIYNPKVDHGVYFACHDPIASSTVLRLELCGGIVKGRKEGNWPQPQDFDDDIPIGLAMHWVKFPYTLPEKTFNGPPVILQFHKGDWQNASSIYRKWFDTIFPLDKSRSWLRKEIAWKLVLADPYKNIPKEAADCAKYNIRTIMLGCWEEGPEPNYRLSPRLGSKEDLKAAIRECHRQGVKVLFFTNYNTIDCNTKWYGEELHKYRKLDTWGNSTSPSGGGDTLSGRLGWTGRKTIKASPGFPEFRKIITDQMVELTRLGADGLHIDKLWTDGELDFNPGHNRNPDLTMTQDMLIGLKEILTACCEVNPNFCLS